MAAPTVLEQIGDWAVCEDAQGVFYHNLTTKQSFDNPPPELLQLVQAAQKGQTAPQNVQPAAQTQPAEAKVVQTVGEWAVCQDAQGIFYRNLRTNENYDQVPPELRMLMQQPQVTQAAPPQPQAEAKVLQRIGDWAICQDAQGLFYQNTRTNETYDQAPPELLGQMQQAQQPKQAAPAQPQSQAKVLQRIGDWAICQDAQGQFFQNLRTNKSYDEPPPELVSMLQGQQARPAKPQVQPQVVQYQTQPGPQMQQYKPGAPMQQYRPQSYQPQSYQPPSYQPQSYQPQSYFYQ